MTAPQLTEIDHVAIAVHDLEAAIDYYQRAFGATVEHREVVESDGVEEALLKVAESYIQLLTPTRDDSPVAKALAGAITTGVPLEEMRKRLLESTVVDGNDLRALAQARAISVRDYFTNVGKIPAERLYVAKERTEGGKEAKGARVTLELQ